MRRKLVAAVLEVDQLCGDAEVDTDKTGVLGNAGVVKNGSLFHNSPMLRPSTGSCFAESAPTQEKIAGMKQEANNFEVNGVTLELGFTATALQPQPLSSPDPLNVAIVIPGFNFASTSSTVSETATEERMSTISPVNDAPRNSTNLSMKTADLRNRGATLNVDPGLAARSLLRKLSPHINTAMETAQVNACPA